MIEELMMKLTNIYCRDEADGPGNAEPYLWTVFFKVDGSTLDHGEVHTTPGNQGNLLAPSVDAGMTVIIPAVIGEYATTVIPIFNNPAIVGCLAILLEEDYTPNTAIAAGHDRLNSLFQAELRKVIQNKISQLLSGGGNLNTLFTEAEVNALKDKIAAEVLKAIKDNLSAWDIISGWGNMDDTIGSRLFIFTVKEIKDHGNSIQFNQRWNADNGSQDGDFEIRGFVTLRTVPSEEQPGLISNTATPSAEFYYHESSDRIYVFHSGTDGNLYVNFWSGASWQWANQGHHANSVIKDSPSALVAVPDVRGAQLSAFVAGQNGRLYQNLWNGAAWSWVDHGLPPGTTVSSAPSALKYSKEPSGELHEAYERIHVFVIGANGQLYSRSWDLNTWQWISHQAPAVNVTGRATVVTMFQEARQRVYAFMRGTDGKLYERYWDGQAWHWTSHNSPAGISLVSDPEVVYVRLNGVNRLYVFLVGGNGNLYARFWDGTAWQWGDLGHPASGIGGRPSAVAYQLGNQSRINVFVRGTNGELQEIFWDGSMWQWSIRGKLNIQLASQPEAISWVQNGVRQIHVAEVGTNNHAYANIWNGQWTWRHQGTP